MDLNNFQLEYISQNHQFILMDGDYIISDSCNSFENIAEFYNKSLFELIPFLESFKFEISALQDNESKLYSCISLTVLNKQSTFDFTFHKRDGGIILIIEDGGDKFIELKELQQERNLSAIEGEVIEKEVKLKSSFLANMSHEIRTPMNIVLGYTDLMLSSNELSVELQDFARNIHLAAKDLLFLIDDILDLSKIDAGYLNIEHNDFNLKELLLNLQQVFNKQCIDNQIEFELITRHDLPDIIKSDRLRISQILTKLISNGIKFTEDGGRIKVSVKLDDLKRNIVFEVIDSGIGIEEDKLDSIFESFSQAESDTTRRFGGTGLGLSIVKKMSDLLEGSVNVKSKLGIGTTFKVEVPWIYADTSSSQREKTSDKIYDRKLLAGKKLLIVEDNIMNQVLINKILESCKVDVTMVNNGKEAIEIGDKKKFDVILMDVQMPILDGLEATRRIINSDSQNSKTPIIALTAHSFKEDIERCRQAGMVDYISKPFNQNKLFSTIIKYIDLPDKESFEISDNSQHYSHTPNNLKLNFDFLKEIANGDKSFMRDFLQTYIHEIEMAIKDMNNYELSVESVEYKKVLHKIKPSLEMIGLLSLRTQVEHFEKQHLITSEDIKQINDTILPPMQNSLTMIEKILSRKEIEL